MVCAKLRNVLAMSVLAPARTNSGGSGGSATRSPRPKVARQWKVQPPNLNVRGLTLRCRSARAASKSKLATGYTKPVALGNTLNGAELAGFSMLNVTAMSRFCGAFCDWIWI